MSGEVLQFKFQAGLEEGVDPKGTPPGALLLAENVRMDKIGRLRKRYGTSSLDAIGISFGARIVSHGDDVTVIDGTSQLTHSSVASLWRTVDRVPALRATWKTLLDTTRSAIDATCAVYNDTVLVTAFCTGTGGAGYIYVEAREIATGALVLPRTVVSTVGTFPRVFMRGTAAVVVFSTNQPGPAGQLAVVEVDIITGVASAQVNLRADLRLSSTFDAQLVGTTLYTAISQNATTHTKIYVDSWNASSGYAAVHSTMVHDVVATNPAGSIALSVTAGEHVYVVYSQPDLAATYYAVLDPTSLAITQAFTSVVAGGTEQVAVVRYDASHALLVYGTAGASEVVSQVVSATGTLNVGQSQRGSFQTRIVSQPWTVGSRFYIALTDEVYSSDGLAVPSPTHAVVEIETSSNGGTNDIAHRIVAVLDPFFAGRNSYASGIFTTQAAQITTGSVKLAMPFLDKPRTLPTEKVAQGYDVLALDLVDTTTATTMDQWRPCPIGPSTFCSAGASFWLDGYVTNPVSFLHPPHITVISASAAGGSMATGTYQYILVAEYRDALGILHRSPTTIAKSIAVTGPTGSVTLTIANTGLSDRQTLTTYGTAATPVRIAVYRTEANGTIFYRLSHDPDLNGALDQGGTQTQTFVDTRADSNIGSSGGTLTLNTQPQLYTAGGILDDEPIPAMITATLHQRRIAALAGDGRTLWLSKDFLDDPLVAPGFNATLTVSFDHDKNALASLDEKLVALGPDSIDIVEGEGSPATGFPFGWTVQRVQSDVGCVQPRSVVSGPFGVMFLSRRGLELLDRGLAISWIGRKVADELVAYPTITSAVLVAAQHEVRWTCIDVNAATGIVLVYDYANGAWFTRRYYDTQTIGANAPFVDAALIGGVYTVMTRFGKVYQESTSTFLDDGSQWVTIKIETAWVSPNGPISWHRIKQTELLGTAVTNHDLQIQVATDYKTTWDQTATFVAGGAVTAPGPLESVRVMHTVQKVQAVRYLIQDATPTNPGTYPVTTGEGAIFEGLGLLTMMKPGLPRRPATKEA